MVKVVKKDYPFTIIIEDKIGKMSGKMYQSISIGHTVVKNKEATDPKEKYETEWFNMFDEKDLLKLSCLAEQSYMTLKEERANKPKQEQAQSESSSSSDDLDDDIPF